MRLSRPQITWTVYIGLAVLVGYFLLFPNYTNRFRLTIEVQTPDGIRSGSSVIETTFFKSGDSGSGRGAWRPRYENRRERRSSWTSGTARTCWQSWGSVPVERTGERSWSHASSLAPGKDVDWKDEYKLKGKGELPSDYIPTLITFADLGDPKTARRVKQADLGTALVPAIASCGLLSRRRASASMKHRSEAALGGECSGVRQNSPLEPGWAAIPTALRMIQKSC